MYDKGKIIIGIFIFLAIFTIPFWYSSIVTGDDDYVPVPDTSELREQGLNCVEDVDYMRAKHVDLLDNWRNDVVRGADREYESKAFSGVIYDKSLTDTCLEQCHTNKTDFCDECHSYVSVEPDCWECHNIVDNSVEGE